MNIFEYLKEEQKLVLDKLAELVRDFNEKTREAIFDDVKLICDELNGYIKKQGSLLFDKITAEGKLTSLLAETIQKREKLVEDLGNLVMVHVDEPGYREYLVNLLKRSQEYFDASTRLYSQIEPAMPKKLLEEVNSALREAMHSDVGFNSLKTPEA